MLDVTKIKISSADIDYSTFLETIVVKILQQLGIYERRGDSILHRQVVDISNDGVIIAMNDDDRCDRLLTYELYGDVWAINKDDFID